MIQHRIVPLLPAPAVIGAAFLAVAVAVPLCAGPWPAMAQVSAPATVADQAAKAAADLSAAIKGLKQAQSARDRVSALTETIRAYEVGLGALREAMRQAELREATLVMQLNASRDRVAQLLGALGQIEKDPAPMLLLHPAGPLGTVRSGMMLADVTPSLQAEVDRLRQEMRELHRLRDLQLSSAQTLLGGLQLAQESRAALTRAIAERTELPRRFTEEPEVLKTLVAGADTLEAFATGLAVGSTTDGTAFSTLMGRLPLPVLGVLIRPPYEADASGVRRPGMALATRPAALVTTPAAATIRYRGPLLDYGNVMVLEPGGGYLLILAGLGTVYGEVGEVLAPGAPVGLMPGAEAGAASVLDGTRQVDAGASGSETLYIEIRQGADPVDPTEWFAATTG
jgi:septal ring factor EnvC (AmiA/AmiB activator)